MHHVKDLLHGGNDNGETWFITAERAEGLHDKDGLGKSDPYCKIKFGHKSFETKDKKNDLSPVWKETFEFHTDANQLEVTVKDKDIGFDDELGTCVIAKNEFPQMKGQRVLVKKPISKKGEITGMVEVAIQRG